MANWVFMFLAVAVNVPFAQAGRLEALVVSEAVFATLIVRHWWLSRQQA